VSLRAHHPEGSKRSRDRLDKRGGPDFESVSEPDDIQQSHIAFAALDAADVVAVEAGQLGQALLGPAGERHQFRQSWLGTELCL
jgi:hypothetical protein